MIRIRPALAYGLIASVAWVAGTLLSYTPLAAQLDNNIYDFLFRRNPPPSSHVDQAIVLAVDENTLLRRGGMRNIRRIAADATAEAVRQGAAVVAVDITLADEGDEADDRALEAAFAGVPALVLACEMMPDGSRWQDPPENFKRYAKGVGHVGALPDAQDAVIREIPLERVANNERRWALSLQAFRLIQGGAIIESSPQDVTVGKTRIESRWDQGRPMRVRFRHGIVRIPVDDLLARRVPDHGLRGKVVFLGVDAQSATRDRYFTPLSDSFPEAGVEIHAQAFGTLQSGRFLVDVPLSLALLASVGAALMTAVLFSLKQGLWAYAGSVLLLAAVHFMPQLLFQSDHVIPATGLIATSWIAVLGCASWQYFVVRRQLARSETDRSRYQQAVQWVTHEMRTPLTAIQGSSELMTRYNLPENKRREIGEMINAESKRLAKMITTFLDVEKLNAGQIDLKRAEFSVANLVNVCVDRARLLAQRKEIDIAVDDLDPYHIQADQELLEYAIYNLLTNAVKYSPPATRISVRAVQLNGELRLSIADQGYGIEEKDLKKIFTKFYRAKSAASAQETGTGIGLSIVDQIVGLHGGRIDVASRPGEGSCFTIILPSDGGKRAR